MDDGITKSKYHFLCFFVLILFPVCCHTKISTVCYGSPGLRCVTHRLFCPSPLVIQIINTSYGYRTECNDKYGLTNCVNTTCCYEEPGDCIVTLPSDDRRISGNCSSGSETCDIHGVRRYIKNDTICNGISAYSKIQYDCVSKGITTIAPTSYKITSVVTKAPVESTSTLTTSTFSTKKDSTNLISAYSTTQYSTNPASVYSARQYSTELTVSTSATIESSQLHVTENNYLFVVGGVLGTLLTISVIINVCLVVYFTRKMRSPSSTPREDNYDGLSYTGRDQTPPTYDVLHVQPAASSYYENMKRQCTTTQ